MPYPTKAPPSQQPNHPAHTPHHSPMFTFVLSPFMHNSTVTTTAPLHQGHPLHHNTIPTTAPCLPLLHCTIATTAPCPCTTSPLHTALQCTMSIAAPSQPLHHRTMPCRARLSAPAPLRQNRNKAERQLPLNYADRLNTNFITSLNQGCELGDPGRARETSADALHLQSQPRTEDLFANLFIGYCLGSERRAAFIHGRSGSKQTAFPPLVLIEGD